MCGGSAVVPARRKRSPRREAITYASARFAPVDVSNVKSLQLVVIIMNVEEDSVASPSSKNWLGSIADTFVNVDAVIT
jgi:hypothetical protein